jgi:ketosteroid isomerase-like protein
MVEDTMERYAAALASQDWSQVEPLIHEDCVAVFSSGTFVGKDEVEGAFRRTFELIGDEEYTISDLHWVSKGDDLAVCRYDFAWSGLINGEPSSGGGRGTSVLRHSDGGWQILLEHLGPPAP